MKTYEIPKELLNKDNVTINLEENGISISLSDDIKNSMKHWPTRKIRDLLRDTKNVLESIYLYHPIDETIKACMYNTVFSCLAQKY